MKKNLIIALAFSALALMQNVTLADDRGLRSPGKFADIARDIEGRIADAIDITRSPSFIDKDRVSSRLLDITSDIRAKINQMELETWAEIGQTFPARSSVAELRYLAYLMAGEKNALFFTNEVLAAQEAIIHLNEAVRHLAVNIDSNIFSDLDRHALMIDYDGVSSNLTSLQQRLIAKFIAEKSKVPHQGRITIFSWSKRGAMQSLADERADKVRKYIESTTDYKDIKAINMHKKPTLFQRIFQTPEYKIKQAYQTHQLSDTREHTIGWFLARAAAGENNLVILFE